jgi:membrane-bound lytic murein transglycosylase A
MRQVSAPELTDDLPLEPLLTAVAEQIIFLTLSPNSKTFRFGDRVYTKEEYLDGLRRFVALARENPEKGAFFEAVEREFDFFEVYGQEDWGEVFITSYYEPVISGSKRPTAKFSQPLYAAPDDLLTLDFTSFDPAYPNGRKYRGRVVGKSFLPYFSREEIDAGAALKGRKLELCWVDPIDAFIAHIQGSVTVDLGGNDAFRLAYAEKNGHRYEALSRYLRDVIPPERMNLHTIEAHLRAMPPGQVMKFLAKNPSYVFFKPAEANALTYMGLPATDGRTIATDPRYFPKGALAFLVSSKPRFEAEDPLVPAGWDEFSRFVLDQDIGGAILGGGRVDLFWGRGTEAKLHAGAMKQQGTLYYLAPKR